MGTKLDFAPHSVVNAGLVESAAHGATETGGGPAGYRDMAGRARSGGRLGMAILAAMAMLFCAIVLSMPLAAAWDEDACITHGPGRAPSGEERSLWPPGTRCSYELAGRRERQVFMDAGRWDALKWPVAALLIGVPVTLAAGLIAELRGLRARPGSDSSQRIGRIAT